jgi:hypothetical protein
MSNFNGQFFLDLSETIKPLNYEVTKSGLLRVRGAIARTGEMTYMDNSGNVYYQYVPPDTLFDEEHLTSIAGIPATLHHPEETVTPENYTKYAIGSVGDRVIASMDKGLLEVVFTIGDAAAINAVTKDGINQLSMGYWATLEPHPTKDKTFIQTRRIANHVALVDKARGGDRLKLNMDVYNVTLSNQSVVGETNAFPEANTSTNNTHEEIKQWRTLYVMASPSTYPRRNSRY